MSASYSIDLEASSAREWSKKGKGGCYALGGALSGVTVGAAVSLEAVSILIRK